jgi:hypothetical protein
MGFQFENPLVGAEIRLFWNWVDDVDLQFVDAVYGERAELASYPELDAYSRFDPALKEIQSRLDPGDRNADDFEWAVCSLLSLLGYQTLWLGYLGGVFQAKEIDIVALMPSRRIILSCECTTKAGDLPNKISVLAERASELEAQFGGWTSHRLLFTNKGLEGIPGSLAEAANDLLVTVISRERLQGILGLARSGFPGEQFSELLRPGLMPEYVEFGRGTTP